jgi:hypothetical protein
MTTFVGNSDDPKRDRRWTVWDEIQTEYGIYILGCDLNAVRECVDH